VTEPDLAGAAWLFCPADRLDRLAKAAAAADVVIADLEDGVPAGGRHAARGNLLRAAEFLDPSRTVVRVNPTGSGEQPEDLRALRETPLRTVMLAKAENGLQLDVLDGFAVIALVETAAGVLAATDIVRHRGCVGVMWGCEDLAADLGAAASRDGAGRLLEPLRQCRWSVLLAARAAGRLAVDTVYTDIPDTPGLRREAGEAADGGYDGKACIHPTQLPVVRDAFTPPVERIERARRLLAAAAEHPGGAFALDGRMVDEPVLRQARRIVGRNRRSAHEG
jgi:citrate lyase subunit beta / citryl-CoA lyase